VKSREERAAARAARQEARRLAGTTRHHELPVPTEEAFALLREAIARRAPMMRMLDHRGDHARVSVAGPLLGPLSPGGNVGAAATMFARAGVGVLVSWAPSDTGTRYTAYAPSLSAMLVMRTEIYSLFRALDDAWWARGRS
jgi:hypothetical protein